jgi:hypothetical protein
MARSFSLYNKYFSVYDFFMPFLDSQCKTRIRWTGHGTCIEEMRSLYRILVRKCEGKLTGIDGRMVLKWV